TTGRTVTACGLRGPASAAAASSANRTARPPTSRIARSAPRTCAPPSTKSSASTPTPPSPTAPAGPSPRRPAEGPFRQTSYEQYHLANRTPGGVMADVQLRYTKCTDPPAICICCGEPATFLLEQKVLSTSPTWTLAFAAVGLMPGLLLFRVFSQSSPMLGA